MAPSLKAAARCFAAGLLIAAACAKREPPSADQPAPPPPDLTGRSVMVLPVQPARGGAAAGLDAELEYWLAERAPAVRWVFPEALDAALARTPTFAIRLRALAVSVFHRAEVRRIGGPLYSDLRGLGALVDARYALIPVAGGYVQRPAGGRVEVAVAIIDTFGGDVLWFGVVGGEAGDAGSRAVVASAARSLARSLFP